MPATRNNSMKLSIPSAAALLTVAILSLTAAAMPPHPDLVEQLRAEGRLHELAQRLEQAKARGVWSTDVASVDPRSPSGKALWVEPGEVDTFRVIVLLVDFSDNEAESGATFAQTADFEHLLFSSNPNDLHLSMTEFYEKNSYGGFYLIGDVAGWYRLPHTYAWYVQGQNGWGSYPQNAQGMAEDAILAADPDVDYSQYDNNGDGWIDGLFIVHAGPGAEQTGSSDQIWSHQWSLPTTLNLDGVSLRDYSMEPEEYQGIGIMTMGVFAHEYGHYLGLPDLYDTDYSSAGVGKWSLMAGGSWNASGNLPAFFDAWCKSQLGFLNPIDVEANMVDVDIPGSYDSSVAYRLWSDGQPGPQYFLVENRRAVGYDSPIPASGLLIYHVDETQGGNQDEWHPLVGIEQADGRNDLQNDVNSGDGGDVWSSQTASTFDDLSIPNTRDYSGSPTGTAVWNISPPGHSMTASFDINFWRPRFTLLGSDFDDAAFGNGNGIPEAGDTITFVFTLGNAWAPVDNVTGTLSCNNSDVTFVNPSANIGTIGTSGSGDNSADPITFTISTDFEPCIDSFFLEITSDNPQGGAWYGLELHLGEPGILVIDDDDGADWERAVTDVLQEHRIPFDVHNTAMQGSPTAILLSEYATVMWLTGDSRPDILSSSDIAAMQGFLDNGGNLFLTGQAILRQLDTDFPVFLSDYLKAEYSSDLLYPLINGVAGSPVGDGLSVRYASGTNQTDPQTMIPTGGSEPAFELPVGGVTGLTYEGSYRLVLFSFGLEGVSDNFVTSGYNTRADVLGRILDFFDDTQESHNPTVTDIWIEGEQLDHVTGDAPTFGWSTADTTGASVQQYQVKVGTGTYCNNRDNVWNPAVFTGDDSTVVYAGQAFEDGSEYSFSVRVYNGQSWSEFADITFRTNSIPPAGQALRPKDDTLVATPTPTLRGNFAADADGDNLTYEFEVFSDSAMTNLVASVTNLVLVSPPYQWEVDVPLAEDERYFWRSRAYDGYEHGDYSEPASFYVNASNQAPSVFDLIAPADGDTVSEPFPLMTWHAASDSDPLDPIEYSLWISEGPSFTTFTEMSRLVDTVEFTPHPVGQNRHFYWKVKAVDLAGAETWSSQTYEFYSPQEGGQGCCQVRGDTNSDQSIDVSDLVRLTSYMFQGGPAPDCMDEADVNGNGSGPDISDLVYLVSYMFSGGPPPPAC